MSLTGANLYTGATVIDAGTLLLGASNVLPDTSPVTLNGGTLATGSGSSDTAGVFDTNASSVIDMATGAAVQLTFASTTTADWSGLLKIFNWNGIVWLPGTTGVSDQIKFTTYSPEMISPSKIQFYSDNGITLVGNGGGIDGGGFLVPVPESTTLASLLALLGLAGYKERKHFLRRR
jgi:autotransporter-associated beta strand protein